MTARVWPILIRLSGILEASVLIFASLLSSQLALAQVTPLALQVTPATNNVASGPQGGPFSPTSFSYTLSGTAALGYSITNVPYWLTPSSTSGTASSGTTVTFTVNANAKSLTPGTYGPNNIVFTNTSKGPGYTIRTTTLTVTPKYMITVTASPSAGGTVSGGGTFAAGSSRTVTATPNSGHTFVHWTESGRVVGTSESYTFTLNGNVTLVADFR
jgi:hypothetical protein